MAHAVCVCAGLPTPHLGVTVRVSRIRETCGRRFRRGRQTCASASAGGAPAAPHASGRGDRTSPVIATTWRVAGVGATQLANRDAMTPKACQAPPRAALPWAEAGTPRAGHPAELLSLPSVSDGHCGTPWSQRVAWCRTKCGIPRNWALGSNACGHRSRPAPRHAAQIAYHLIGSGQRPLQFVCHGMFASAARLTIFGKFAMRQFCLF